MQGVWTDPKDRAWSLVLGAVVGLHLGCGGSEFSSAGTGAASGMSSGGRSNGGYSGSASSGGGRAGNGAAGSPSAGTSASGNGGAAGETSTGCACPSGQYCREGSTDCRDCADFARLRFSAPERLSTLSDLGEGTLRFPRVGEAGGDLFYRSQAVGTQTNWYTTDVSTSAGNPLDPTFPPDGAPLLLGMEIAGPTQEQNFNFVFNRTVPGGLEKLFFARWAAGLQGAREAPAPYNALGTNDYSLAIATQPTGVNVPRAYWMTDRDLVVGLVTTLVRWNSNSAVVPVPLKVGRLDCGDEPADLTPWVTPDGTSLLFNTTALDDSCAPSNNGADLYVAPMDPVSGQQRTDSAVVPLSDVNGPAQDRDPSFSRDFCELYFSSDRGGSSNFDLYRARRR